MKKESSKAPTLSQLDALAWIYTLELCTLPQVGKVSGMSAKALYKHIFSLVEQGYVHERYVTRASMADIGDTLNRNKVQGRGPRILSATRKGEKAIYTYNASTLVPACRRPIIPVISKIGENFMAHEVQIRDVFCWMYKVGEAHDHPGLSRFDTGGACKITLNKTTLIPDAIFDYYLKEDPDPKKRARLFGWIEVDRGSERGVKQTDKWPAKVIGYQTLLNSGANGRVLIITPRLSRTIYLRKYLEDNLGETSKYWLTERQTLEGTNLWADAWQTPGDETIKPLLPIKLKELFHKQGTFPYAEKQEKGSFQEN